MKSLGNLLAAGSLGAALLTGCGETSTKQEGNTRVPNTITKLCLQEPNLSSNELLRKKKIQKIKNNSQDFRGYTFTIDGTNVLTFVPVKDLFDSDFYYKVGDTNTFLNYMDDNLTIRIDTKLNMGITCKGRRIEDPKVYESAWGFTDKVFEEILRKQETDRTEAYQTARKAFGSK